MSNMFTKVRDLFGLEDNRRYIIPPFQREYSWDRTSAIQLIDDLDDFGDEYNNEEGYFLGSLLLTKDVDNTFHDPYIIIDGQQRLTTISLIYLAIYDIINEHGKKSDISDYIVKKLVKDHLPRMEQRFTKNNIQDYFGLLIDKGVLNKELGINIMRKHYPDKLEAFTSVKNSGNRRIYSIYNDIKKRLINNEKDSDNITHYLESFYKRLNESIVVNIIAKSSTDAFILFESLNNRGKPLTLIDLLKIDFFLGEDESEAEKLWIKMLENLVDQDNISYHTSFLINYYESKIITIKDNENNNFTHRVTRGSVLNNYKKLFKLNNQYKKDLVDNASVFAKIYSNTEFKYEDFFQNKESNNNALDIEIINKKIYQLNLLGSTQMYPLLFYYMHSTKKSIYKLQYFEKILDLLIKYFIRRNITNYPQARDVRSLSLKIIIELSKNTQLTHKEIYESIRANLVKNTSEDTYLISELNKNLYDDRKTLKRILILLELENNPNNKEKKTDFDEVIGKNPVWEIEHILPQGKTLPEYWIRTLMGLDNDQIIDKETATKAYDIKEKYEHTLGNLTLTGYNPELSNKSFEDKKHIFKEKSKKLYINSEIYNSDSWTEKEIIKRSKSLIEGDTNVNLLKILDLERD